MNTVKLLKLDCEGSEFPILLTSNLLHKVERIVGEYHEIDSGTFLRLTPHAKVAGCRDYTAQRMMRHLWRKGFQTRWDRQGPNGFFEAYRAGC